MIKKILRVLICLFSELMHNIFGKYRCSICKKKVIKFRPLPKFYFNAFKQYGYKTGSAETCNRDQYSCPHCGAADRDRLYAIYLRQFISEKLSLEIKSFKILDLAPAKSLFSFIISEFSGSPKVYYRTADLYADESTIK